MKSDPSILHAASRAFVIDSGASYHLISYNLLSEEEQSTIRPIEEPSRIQTANGTLTIREEVRIQVPSLKFTSMGEIDGRLPVSFVVRHIMFKARLEL